MQDAQQTSIPALDPFDITQRLFALSATLPDQRNPTLSDAIKAIEGLPESNLLGLNHLPYQGDFVSSMNSLLGPRHYGAPITDPALQKIHRGLIQLLATSRYRRGIDGGVCRESFLVAPMVVFLGQHLSNELRFDVANFNGALPPSGQVIRFLGSRYGGEFFQGSPLLSLWPDYVFGNSDDSESERAMPFAVQRAAADSIIENGALSLEPGDQALEYLCSQEFFGLNEKNEFLGPRAHVAGLPLIHSAPVGQHVSMLSEEDVPLEFQCLSEEMKADAPLIVGKDCSIILLKPQPINLAKVSMGALTRWLQSMQTELIPARLRRTHAGYRARINTIEPPALACRITNAVEYDGQLPAFSGSPDALALIDELFEHLCAASHIKIRDVELEAFCRGTKT